MVSPDSKMLNRWWSRLTGYLLLSGLIYAVPITLILWEEALPWNEVFEALLPATIPIGVDLALQAVFVVLLWPSRRPTSGPIWRVILAAMLVGALLTTLLGIIVVMLDDIGLLVHPLAFDVMMYLSPIGGLAMMIWLSAWGRGKDRMVVLKRMVACVAAPAIATLCLAGVAAFVLWHQPPRDWKGVATSLGACMTCLTLAWCLGPLFIFLHFRRVRTAWVGCCPACQYELRGLSEMRCPECGRPFTFEELGATAKDLEFAGQTG